MLQPHFALKIVFRAHIIKKVRRIAMASLDLENMDIRGFKAVGFAKIKFLAKKLEHFSHLVHTSKKHLRRRPRGGHFFYPRSSEIENFEGPPGSCRC